MKNLFIPYELAVKLKEKGFKELNNHFYSQDGKLIPRILSSGNEPMNFEPSDFYENFNTIAQYEVNGKHQHVITAPTYQQVIDWFEKKELFINWDVKTTDVFEYTATVKGVVDYNLKTFFGTGIFPSKEKALVKAIEEAIKLINL